MSQPHEITFLNHLEGGREKGGTKIVERPYKQTVVLRVCSEGGEGSLIARPLAHCDSIWLSTKGDRD